MDQTNSVFLPGLTNRGPVYRGGNVAFGALPTVSPMVKYGIMAALVYLGIKKKIPMYIAGAGALAVWNFLPSTDASAATPPINIPNAADVNSVNAPVPAFDTSQITMPVMPGISSQ